MNIDIQRVAGLAHIRLTDTEAQALAPQMDTILKYVDSLKKVDTTGTLETAHPHDAAMPLRDDVVTNSNRRDALQAPAPAVESGLYIVPKVLES